jgi:hypothetical protein
LEIKANIKLAQENAANLKSNITHKLILQPDNKTMALDSSVVADESFKRIANYILTSDIRKHNKYCPCCKQYEEGAELTLTQMGEFLEYIR